MLIKDDVSSLICFWPFLTFFSPQQNTTNQIFSSFQVRCSFCPKIFCCVRCRCEHEEREHVSDTISQSCFICIGQPLVLKADLPAELLAHIVDTHLPLRCPKCSKTYTSKDQFGEIEKCIRQMDVDDKENSAPKKLNVEKLLEEGQINEEMLTPLSKINLKWRRKSAGLQAR